MGLLPPNQDQNDNLRIHVDGSRLVTAGGRQVGLRGVGLGGWLNMENFITGYPATEDLQRAALRQVLAQDAYEAYFDQFYQAFFADEDAAYLASPGLNRVRIAVKGSLRCRAAAGRPAQYSQCHVAGPVLRCRVRGVHSVASGPAPCAGSAAGDLRSCASQRWIVDGGWM